jgi:hypothetical protein
MIGIGLVLWAVYFLSFKGTPSRIFHKKFQRHSAQIINNVVHKTMRCCISGKVSCKIKGTGTLKIKNNA